MSDAIRNPVPATVFAELDSGFAPKKARPGMTAAQYFTLANTRTVRPGISTSSLV